MRRDDNDKNKNKEPVEDIAAKAIREAMERGDFNNLPGKGKPPLHLDPGEMADPVRVANKVRKNASLPSPWSLLEQEIEHGLQRARAEIMLAARRRHNALNNRNVHVEAIERDWNHALDTLRLRIDELNKKVVHFNLKLPPQLPHLYKRRFRIEDVLEQVRIPRVLK